MIIVVINVHEILKDETSAIITAYLSKVTLFQVYVLCPSIRDDF